MSSLGLEVGILYKAELGCKQRRDSLSCWQLKRLNPWCPLAVLLNHQFCQINHNSIAKDPYCKRSILVDCPKELHVIHSSYWLIPSFLPSKKIAQFCTLAMSASQCRVIWYNTLRFKIQKPTPTVVTAIFQENSVENW